jgi:hypothetical protein
MARVRSTTRVERDGDETEATETVPISEAMRRSGLVSSEDTPAAEATQANVEEAGSEDEYSCGVPSKLVIWILESLPSSKLISLKW